MTDEVSGAAWDAAVLRRLAETHEVEIETRRLAGGTRRTIIWIVADDDAAYVRSVRGDRGWWYRELTDAGVATIHAGGETVRVRARRAADDHSIEKVSRLLREKYGGTQRASTASMLRPDTLHTTLRLDPA